MPSRNKAPPRRGAGDGFSVEVYGPGRGAPEAGGHLGQFPLAVAGHACDSDDLSGSNLQVDVVEGGESTVVQGAEP